MDDFVYSYQSYLLPVCPFSFIFFPQLFVI